MRARAANDPIAPELLRTRLEAIGQEAGAAVEQTAISPVVTESKDYSVTLCDADGAVVSASGVVELHFGAVMHAVRSTLARHGETIAEGDVFIANDPHSGGGLHPQDIVIQRPVFACGRRVAWVALAAHMMDMGGMVPGSSAAEATECYQEALRLPPVRLIRRGEEVSDIWNILRTNIRSAALIEMDMRALVIGAGVAAGKLAELVGEMGVEAFAAAAGRLIAGCERVLRERIAALEDGHYLSAAWVEYGDTVLRIPCDLHVLGDRLQFDLTQAPAQVPHFFNSKAYIIRSVIGPRLRQILAPGLPYNQAIYDVVELATTSGTVVDCVMPAPIAAAHTDAAMAVYAAAGQCMQLAIHASPNAVGREFIVAPDLAAYGTGRWNYLDETGQRRVYTLIDGAFSGSPAGYDRDGLDLHASLTGGGTRIEYADVEILETAYPILFRDRSSAGGRHGYGAHRSGAGCSEAFRIHGTDALIGNMTGTRAWFPTGGGAGGLPGAPIRFAVARADGGVEPVGVHAVGVTLRAGDHFEMLCATGGGYGDPLDREPTALVRDLEERRLDAPTAREIYGLALASDGTIDEAATEARRTALRRERLRRARPASRPAAGAPPPTAEVDLPIYPGVVQRGAWAVAERSGALLARAPDNWLDGCPVLETPIPSPAEPILMRAHLDPSSGRMLHVDVVRPGDGPTIEIRPERWVSLGQPAPVEAGLPVDLTL
jgi:N-methylhydantoinase B